MAKSIEVVLKLNDRDFTRGIKRANRELDKFQRNVKQTRSSNTQLSGGGQGGFGGLATAVAAFGSAAALSGNNLKTNLRLQKSFGDGISTNITRLGEYFKKVQGTEKSSSELYNVTRLLKNNNEDFRQSYYDLTQEVDKAQKSQGVMTSRSLKFVSIAALVGAAVGGIVISFQNLKSALTISAEFEQIEITLGNLTGSAEKGARALDVITQKAQELPFSFRELAGASPVLLTVSKNLEEFQTNIQLAADIAANFGIPFEQAASSLQRAFSAGAAAADVFREKGVLAAAGFQAGVSYSVEETIQKFNEFGDQIEGVSSKLNTSLTGAVSQAGDAFTQFQKAIGDSIKPELTVFLNNLVTIVRNNKEEIDKFAKAFGEGALNAIIGVARAGAVILDVFSSIFGVVKSVNNILVENFGPGLLEVATSIYVVTKAVNAFKIAQMAAANAAIFLQGVTGVGLLKVGAGIAAAAATAATLSVAFDKAAESFTTLGTEGEPNSNLGKLNALIADMQLGVEGLAPAAVAATEPLKELTVDIATGAEAAADSIKDTKTALQKYREELEFALGTTEEYNVFLARLNELFETGQIGIEEYRNLLRDLQDQFSQNEGLNNFLDTLGSAQKSLSEDLVEAFRKGESASGSFKKFFKTVIDQIIADIFRLAVIQPILSTILGPFGYGFGTGGNVIKLPGKADGGPVMKNKPYIVGEEGPELFVPSSAGNIVPNGQFGGGGTTVNYNIQAVDAPSFQQLVARDPEFIFNVSRAGSRRTPA